MSAALTLANGVEEAFLGRVPTDAFCSEVGSVFFVAFLLAHCLMFVFFTLTGEIIKFFHLQKKSTFFESG